jgi:hypothetical protein
MSHELLDHPHWVAGRRYMKEQNFELAIEMFANLVQELEEEFGAGRLRKSLPIIAKFSYIPSL